MATGPHVSVIMSVYNGADYLYPCIHSILQQSFRDFEFLIMDDGSTDGSTEILREMAKADSRIRLVIRENRGLVASLNELIDIAKAPLLGRMDCDDIAMPDRFMLQTAFLAEHPEIGILGCDTHDLDENGLLTGRGDDYPKDPSEAKIALKNGPPICHPAVIGRRFAMPRIMTCGSEHRLKHALRVCHNDCCCTAAARNRSARNTLPNRPRVLPSPGSIICGAAKAKIVFLTKWRNCPNST
jgi:glycosyltransferase involved in cell wall biosynthesis